MQPDIQKLANSINELWSTGNTSLVRQVYTDNCVRYDPSTPEGVRGTDGMAGYVNQFRTAYPDLRAEVKDVVTEGNFSAFHWNCTGTHKGDFFGIAPTGKRVNVNGVSFCRIQNGKISEDRTYFDRLGLMEQLGVAPETTKTRRATT